MKVIDHQEKLLRLLEIPTPEPGPDEVRISVHYAGVNRPDLLQRRGLYPPPKNATPYLGLEVSGVISALGANVKAWSLGQPVCALTPGGGYAQEVITPSGCVFTVPSGLTMCQAGALPETYLTVWANLIERGKLCSGETVLIHGGSSGIGVTAIQIAKWRGATVITTAGSDEKCEACLSLGADHAINYTATDFQEEIKKITAGAGVELILDMVGGPYIEKNLRCLADEGRLVQIAFLKGSKAEVDWTTLMMRRLTFTGSTLRARSTAEKSRLVNTLQQHIWPELSAGKLLPVIHSEFPMDQAEKAHALMESSRHIGKIMLRIGP